MTKQIKLFGGIIIIAAYLVLFFFAAQTIDFYKLLIAGVVSLLSFSFVSRFGINEKIVGNETTYNPSEFPWYVAIFIVELSGYALYKNINHELLSFQIDNYALLFIIFYFILPSLVFLVILILNKNDKIIISDASLIWIDNKKKENLLISNIRSTCCVTENIGLLFSKTKLIVDIVNGESIMIPVHKMNFTKKGATQVSNHLNSLLKK
jgi:hypothetical protein